MVVEIVSKQIWKIIKRSRKNKNGTPQVKGLDTTNFV